MEKSFTTYLTAILVSVLLMAGCAPKEKNVCYVDPLNWSKSADIIYQNNDTNAVLDISFFVRYNADFDIKTLPVIVRSSAPDSSITIDQFIWSFDGEKAPTPTATIQKVAYRFTCLLNQTGKYTFSVVPMQAVKGVEAVGLIVEEGSYIQ